MDDWDLDPSQFDDDYITSRLNEAMITILDTTDDVMKEMRGHLTRNERTQFQNKLSYLVNRLSQLAQLAEVEDKEDYTEEDIERLCQEAELHSEHMDYNKLFNNGEEVEKGVDAIKYTNPDNGEEDDTFGF